MAALIEYACFASEHSIAWNHSSECGRKYIAISDSSIFWNSLGLTRRNVNDFK